MRLVTAVSLHSFQMGFVLLICRCYEFLYIRLPFSWSFWEVPKYTLFASQKNREVRLSWVWYTILFFFSKAVVYWIPYYHFRSLLQEQRVSFFNFWCHFWCHSEFSVHLFTFLVHFSVYFIEFLSTFSVYFSLQCLAS